MISNASVHDELPGAPVAKVLQDACVLNPPVAAKYMTTKTTMAPTIHQTFLRCFVPLFYCFLDLLLIR